MKILISSILLVLIIIIPLAFSTSLHTPQTLEIIVHAENSTENESERPAPLRKTSGTIGRFLAEGRTRRPSPENGCDKDPRICWGKSSVARHCCKKRCVDTSTDRLNCGVCGNRCKHPEKCCRGRCVDTNSDERNCGRCENRCENGNSSTHGMCGYSN